MECCTKMVQAKIVKNLFHELVKLTYEPIN